MCSSLERQSLASPLYSWHAGRQSHEIDVNTTDGPGWSSFEWTTGFIPKIFFYFLVRRPRPTRPMWNLTRSRSTSGVKVHLIVCLLSAQVHHSIRHGLSNTRVKRSVPKRRPNKVVLCCCREDQGSSRERKNQSTHLCSRCSCCCCVT